MGLVIQEDRGKYFYIKLVGDRNFFAELLKGLCRIGTLVKSNNSSRLLLDYSHVNINFAYSQSTIFRLLHAYVHHLDRSQRVCILLGERYMQEGKIFTELCRSRGYNKSEVFTCIQKAEEWLISDEPEINNSHEY